MRERDRAPDRIAQIDLAFDHVCPRRRVRVFEIGHENFRAGIERVDHHFAIGRAGDFHSTILQIAPESVRSSNRLRECVSFAPGNPATRHGRMPVVDLAGVGDSHGGAIETRDAI